MIPSVYASAGASGVITRKTFDYIESLFVRTVKEHLHEIDGIYLHLHGASEVEGLGSGDHHILAAIRKLTDALKCRLRHDMLHTYYRHREDRTIRQYELEDFLFLYRGYKALGDNSFIDRIKSEIDEWEVVS